MSVGMLERKRKAREVFGISRDLPENYVTRSAVDAAFVDYLTKDKHIIVHGSSKQGKTSLRKYNLKPDDYIIASCQNKWDIGELNSAILKSAGYEVSQSTTLSTSGRYKIVASVEGKAGLPLFAHVKGSGGLEGENSNESRVVREKLELDPRDVNDVIMALNELGFDKYVILEDFHYLPTETQKDFSFSLKTFHEQSRITFIIIGVWKEENRLTRFNGDLTNRVIPIDVDRWTTDELQEVISLGERLLNVTFRKEFRDDLVENCYNSVYIVQEVCMRACEQASIFETQSNPTVVPTELFARGLIKKVVEEQSGRYRAFLNSFAYGFSETKLEMYKWIIFVILKSKTEELEEGVRLQRIVQMIKANHPEGVNLQTANVTNALGNIASLQAQKDVRPIVLDYDENNRKIDVVDKSFLVWLSAIDVNEQLQDLDLPS